MFHCIWMLVSIFQKRIYLKSFLMVAFINIVLIPPEFSELLQSPTDISQTLCLRLRTFFHSFDSLICQFWYQSTQNNSEYIEKYPLLSYNFPAKPSFLIQATSRAGSGGGVCWGWAIVWLAIVVSNFSAYFYFDALSSLLTYFTKFTVFICSFL